MFDIHSWLHGLSKFIVIKKEDLLRINSVFKLAMLDNDLKDIQASREAEGKNPCPKYLVVNIDEPYAGRVADLIEAEERRKGTWDHGNKSLREVMGIEKRPIYSSEDRCFDDEFN